MEKSASKQNSIRGNSLAMILVKDILDKCYKDEFNDKYVLDYESLVLSFDPDDYRYLRLFTEGK